ncbi:unnamed protein product [Larinioides sclopetarius]|uniref:Uncharacterized protein n=1 Tax=Larinioides sclopetarius TaxID=280406 RepID=A0AAV2B0M5_9ARAC
MMEDVEGVEFLINEETVTRFCDFDNVNEDTEQKSNHKRCAVQKFVSWRVFKTLVFISCLICLIFQSIEFLKIYYKYPTNIVLESIVEKDFKLPAVTLCFMNTVSTKTFCQYSSSARFCEKPNNLKEFCMKHPMHCIGNISNLKIPMTGYYTNYSKNPEELSQNYLIFEEFDAKQLYVKDSYIKTSTTRTFVNSSPRALKCYSENLHLYQSGVRPTTMEIDFNYTEGSYIMGFQLNLFEIRFFYASSRPQVFIGIHSPFVPNNPLEDGLAIYPGKSYELQVELEKEEHSLPPPYQTSCSDNGPSEDVKPFTNPNSYQMCLEMCKGEFSTKVYGCNLAFTMVSSLKDLCLYQKYSGEIPSRYFKPLSELKKKRHRCMQNCKQECLKLQYKYTVAESDLISESSGEVFSYVGGLAGFWLGVSVFSFTDIIEKLYRKAMNWMVNFRLENVQNALFLEAHHD